MNLITCSSEWRLSEDSGWRCLIQLVWSSPLCISLQLSSEDICGFTISGFKVKMLSRHWHATKIPTLRIWISILLCMWYWIDIKGSIELQNSWGCIPLTPSLWCDKKEASKVMLVESPMGPAAHELPLPALWPHSSSAASRFPVNWPLLLVWSQKP